MGRPWLVFDLDETLCLRDGRLFQEARAILEFLAEQQLTTCLASFNLHADLILEHHHLSGYFSALEFGRDRSKAQMIVDIANRLGLDLADAVLFDDLESNCRGCCQELIYSVQVNPNKGVSLAEVKALLQLVQQPVVWMKITSASQIPLLQNIFSGYWVRYTYNSLPLEQLALRFAGKARIVGEIGEIVGDYGRSYVVRLQELPTGLTASSQSCSISDCDDLEEIYELTNHRTTDVSVFNHALCIAVGRLEQKLK